MAYDHTILLAHGSRDPRWSQPFRDLCSKLGSRTARISLAFMELCDPDLQVAIDQAVAGGATRIAVLPLFLAAGRHLREDVPGQIERIRQTHGVVITLLPAIGEQPVFASFLETLILGLVTEEH